MTLTTNDTVLEDPNIARTAAIGAVIGVTVVTIGVTLAGLLGGLGFGGAVGLGLFIGMWGGGGFGFMMGGTIPFARHMDRADAAASSHHRR